MVDWQRIGKSCSWTGIGALPFHWWIGSYRSCSTFPSGVSLTDLVHLSQFEMQDWWNLCPRFVPNIYISNASWIVGTKADFTWMFAHRIPRGHMQGIFALNRTIGVLATGLHVLRFSGISKRAQWLNWKSRRTTNESYRVRFLLVFDSRCRHFFLALFAITHFLFAQRSV